MSNDELAKLLRNFEPPAIVADAGSVATYAHAEFFSAQIRSPNTRKAYRRAVDRFLAWCDDRNLGFQEISSLVISEYLDHHLVKDSGQPLSTPSIKFHLAALKHFYDAQERRHGVLFNPATPPYDPIPRYAEPYLERELPLLEVTQAELDDQPPPLQALRVYNTKVDHDSVVHQLKPTHEQRHRQRAYYLAHVTMIDEKVGEVLAALNECGYLDKAIVIFTSDHGDCLTDHGHSQK